MKIVKLTLVVLVVGIGAVIYGIRMYNKPHLDVSTHKAEYHIRAMALIRSFRENEQESNQLYLNKVLEVTGKVKSLTTDNDETVIVLGVTDDPETVRCVMTGMREMPGRIKVGNEISIRGICTGYLLDVVLVRCIVVNQLNALSMK